MNPMWDAAEAALALAQECLGGNCVDYARKYIETSAPVADCNSLVVAIGAARALSGSCVGKIQLSSSLDIHLIRCCEPAGDLSSQGGYTPPSPDEIEAAAACIVRDAWTLYECFMCQACDIIGSVQGVTACCDKNTGPPDLRFGAPSGGCRSAVLSLPVVFTPCCNPPEPSCGPEAPFSVESVIDPGQSGGQGCILFTGCQLDQVDKIVLNATPFTLTYFNPSGPQGFTNGPSFNVITWSSTEIRFCEDNLSGATIDSIDLIDVNFVLLASIDLNPDVTIL